MRRDRLALEVAKNGRATISSPASRLAVTAKFKVPHSVKWPRLWVVSGEERARTCPETWRRSVRRDGRDSRGPPPSCAQHVGRPLGALVGPLQLRCQILSSGHVNFH